jgi:hypothetical protein
VRERQEAEESSAHICTPGPSITRSPKTTWARSGTLSAAFARACAAGHLCIVQDRAVHVRVEEPAELDVVALQRAVSQAVRAADADSIRTKAQ